MFIFSESILHQSDSRCSSQSRNGSRNQNFLESYLYFFEPARTATQPTTMAPTIDDLYPSDPDEYSSSDDDIASSAPPKTPSPERMYRGSPTRTMLLRAERKRVAKRSLRKEVPNTRNVKQARDGKVKAFSPKIHRRCCKRRCCKDFNDPNDPQLVLARKPLYDATLSRETMRMALKNNAVDLLRHKDDGEPVCSAMVNIAYSCSTSFLTPNDRRSKDLKQIRIGVEPKSYFR